MRIILDQLPEGSHAEYFCRLYDAQCLVWKEYHKSILSLDRFINRLYLQVHDNPAYEKVNDSITLRLFGYKDCPYFQGYFCSIHGKTIAFDCLIKPLPENDKERNNIKDAEKAHLAEFDYALWGIIAQEFRCQGGTSEVL